MALETKRGHSVKDAGILCNAKDPPSERAVIAADGARMAVTKVGDIQTPHIKIEDVYLVPGLHVNLIKCSSAREEQDFHHLLREPR
ncbi:hypothetical protein ACP4OV_002323 [Aristida adscensionis]